MISDDRRNPYVLLGLPYGASVNEARRAFARRARDARWGDRAGADLSDLEWALARIEFLQHDPAAMFGVYRVPADPSVLRAPAGFGLLAPAPRAAPRRSPVTPEEDLAVVFDAARLDAAQHLLDRTAAAVGRRLERTSEAPLPVVSVPAMPVRRRGWLPIVLVAVLAVGVLAAAAVRTLTGDDDEVAATSTSVAPDTTVAETTPETTAAATTTTSASDRPGFGDPIEFGGIEITPDQPIDAFGHLCIVFTIDGDVPLGFIREQVTLISGGVAYDPALGITTGRADNTDVFGDPAPTTREICFGIEGWRDRDTDLVYATQVGNYRWRLEG